MSRVTAWLDDRLDLSGLRHFIAEKGVPVHAQQICYYLGGMTLFLFMVQVASGILLLLYYQDLSARQAFLGQWGFGEGHGAAVAHLEYLFSTTLNIDGIWSGTHADRRF